MSEESVTTIIPVYNGEKYIIETIQSILNQTVTPQELIIINDGSTDQTVELVNQVIEKYNTPVNVKLFSQANQGVGTALKKGIELSNSIFLTFMDADNLWDRKKLERQLDYLEKHPEIDMVFGMAKQFISPELSAGESAKMVCPTEPMKGLIAGAMCIRKSRYYVLGEFDPNISLCPFIDWFSRASLQGINYHCLEEVVLYRRLHTSNVSRKKKTNVHKQFTAILRDRIKAKRKFEEKCQ